MVGLGVFSFGVCNFNVEVDVVFVKGIVDVVVKVLGEFDSGVNLCSVWYMRN